MKIELVKHEGKTVGWTIIAETTEDKLKLGTMRNMEFFGMDDNVVQYDGVSSENDEAGASYATKLHYATKAYQKIKRG